MSDAAVYPRPSARARKLVEGAVDLHIHVSPDVMPRRIDDLTLAHRFRDLGLAGFVLKSHYVPTAERAAVLRKAVPEVHALGSLTLNAAVGGLNPLAVEIAAREGARIVWLPTVDAVNERQHLAHHQGPLPQWAQLQESLRAAGFEAAPVAVVDEQGQPLPALHQVLQVVARHQLVLATGHLSRDEIMVVVAAARAAGIRDVIITHPDYPTQALSSADQVALAEAGAWIEHCLAPILSGKVAWETSIAHIQAVGPEHVVLSTDLGQPANPPVEDGLALFVDRLLAEGFSEDAVWTMAVRNTRRLAFGEEQ